jgi:hypothetical protein
MGLVLLAGGLCQACSSTPTSNSSPAVLSGQVVDESAVPIAGASLRIGGTRLSTVSSADGNFSLTLPQSSPGTVPLMAESPRHARTIRLLSPSDGGVLVVMHPYDVVSSVTLPGATGAPAVVTVNNPIGTASLSLTAGSLVLPNGTPATGAVEVRMAYWSGADDHIAAPSMLWGIVGDGSYTKLDSLGMADFAIFQSGTELQVAPGQTLTLSLPTTADQNQRLLTQNATLPDVYAVDPNLGVWSYAGALSLGQAKPQQSAALADWQVRATRNLGAGDNVRAVLANGTLKIFVGASHAWNIDAGIQLSAGGCITGRTVDACSKAVVANTAFTHYFLGTEEVAGFEGQSNSAGTFCTATPFSTFINQPTQASASIKYIVSAKDTAAQTAYCNPAAAHPACFVPHPVNIPGTNTLEPGQINFISGCRLGQTDLLNAVQTSGTVVRYNDSCQPAAAALSITPCTFCSAASAPAKCTATISDTRIMQATNNASCTQLGDVPVPTATCKCNNGTCTPVCKTSHLLGSPCFVDPKDSQNSEAIIACCSTDKAWPLGSLSCRDDVCVATSSLKRTPN